jgi:hypothetical protein
MLRTWSTVNVALRCESECFNITMTGSGLPKCDQFTIRFCTEHVAGMGEILKCIQGFIETWIAENTAADERLLKY